MTTLASEQIRWIADQWENHCGYASAVLSGIIPDARHLDNGGYHCSVEDLIRYGNQNDYSNVRPDDKGFNPDYGAAADMSMSPADMKLCHDRVRRVWADTTDPRRKYINAINTWDGSGDAVRLDFYAGTAKYATPDHKWHNHAEERRRYLQDWTAAKAYVSVLKGEAKATYLSSLKEDDDMASFTDAHAKTLDQLGTALPNLIAQVGYSDGRWEAAASGRDKVRSDLKGGNSPVWLVTQVKAILAQLQGLGEVIARESANPDEVRELLAQMPTGEQIAEDVLTGLAQRPAADVVATLQAAGYDLADLRAEIDRQTAGAAES